MIDMDTIGVITDGCIVAVAKTEDNGRTLSFICNMTPDEHASYHARVVDALNDGKITREVLSWFDSHAMMSVDEFNSSHSPTDKLAVTMFLVKLLGI